MVLIRRIALLLLAACASALATVPNPWLGFGFGGGATCGSACGGGSTLAISTASLTSCVTGIDCTQELFATGGTGTGYVFNKVSEYPNTDFWDYITPNGTRSGTPQYAETETVTYQVRDSGGHTAQKTFSLVSSASGSLAIVSPTTLPTAPINGYYAYRFTASGGLPPYIWTGTPVQPCNLTFEGWLVCSTTTAGTTSFSVTVTDQNGATATESVSFTATTTLQFGRTDPIDGIVHLPSAYVGAYYKATLHAYAGTSPYSFTATGLPSWASLNASTGVITGTPTASGNVVITATVSDSASGRATMNALINVASAVTATRPSYNTSSAFFVKNGQLYDPTGAIFHIRGVNQLHYGNDSTICCAQNTGANAIRIWDGNHSTTTYLSLANGYLASGMLPIVTQASTPSGTGTSGDTSDADLQAVVTWWVSNESAFAPIMNEMALNIANEWNGTSRANWATTYESMIPQLRTAGYTSPIIVDAYDQGEDLGSLIQYGAAIIASDPEQNVILSWHGYRTEHNQQAQIASVTTGSVTTVVLESNAASSPIPSGWVSGYYIYNAQGLTQLNGAQPANTNITGSAGSWTITLNVNSMSWGSGSAYVANSATIVLDTVDQGGEDIHYRRAGDLIVSSGLPIIMGEFGPGNKDTASDNFTGFVADADFGQTIAGFESYGTIGWIDWAFDDNNQAGCMTSWANWWGLVQAACSGTAYPPASDLTGVGLDVIPNPRRGLDALGYPASSIH